MKSSADTTQAGSVFHRVGVAGAGDGAGEGEALEALIWGLV